MLLPRFNPTSVELHQTFEGRSTDWTTRPRLKKENISRRKNFVAVLFRNLKLILKETLI